jgi:hypothetical protein
MAGTGEGRQELRLLARASQWRRMLEEGEYGSIAELARAEKINPFYVGRVLKLRLPDHNVVGGLRLSTRTRWEGGLTPCGVTPQRCG